MIALDNVRVEFDGEPLFDNISFLIQPKDKIGLVGNNGAGKTTLLKVIMGKMKPESGEVHLPSNIKLGYLPQQMQLTEDECVYESVYQSLKNIAYYRNLIDNINKDISERNDFQSETYFKLLDNLKEATEHYHILGGDTIEAEIEKTLLGLGFEATDMQRNLSEFSGGWRMRVELAKILLNQPDLLLLDEPTNHLDIEAIQWFENYLKNFNGAVILISHDRAFLDTITNRTLELSLGKL
ncbi:MAG: ATP-binding cassette domain-containing protein, partial [Bacteroidales bacterium]